MSQLSQVPESRRAILARIKREQSSTIAELAAHLGMTGEAVRQQLIQLQREGWITTTGEREAHPHHSGRPAAHYRLTPEGDHLFPKRYDSLLIALIDAIARLDGERVNGVFDTIIDEHVAHWDGVLQGCAFGERVDALRNVYMHDDPYAEVEHLGDGSVRVVQRNCPFLNAAVARPAVCRIPIETLRRVLHADVRREESFQNGDGRCVFRIAPGNGGEGH